MLLLLHCIYHLSRRADVTAIYTYKYRISADGRRDEKLRASGLSSAPDIRRYVNMVLAELNAPWFSSIHTALVLLVSTILTDRLKPAT